ncbi:MAG: hypothetical protein ACI9R3_005945 [Verrucomicrobiales bacterium]|jgi:hypothetical protein
MKIKTTLSIILALPLAMASCSKDDPAASDTGKAAEGDYPLTTCVVSGEELGSMGEPVVKEHNGKTVKFCCKSCLPKFDKDPETYMAKIK